MTELLNARSRRTRTQAQLKRHAHVQRWTVDSEAASYDGRVDPRRDRLALGQLHGPRRSHVPMESIMHSQDAISEQVHTVNFTCLDYLSMLNRRFVTQRLNYVQWDQDDIDHVTGRRSANAAIERHPRPTEPRVFARRLPAAR